MDDKFSNIKIVFLPKNTASRLQPLDAGIIQNFKVKYRKSLVKYVFLRINDNLSAAEVVQDVNILWLFGGCNGHGKTSYPQQ